MSDVKLKFINMSNDSNNSQVVIFQKNVATDYGELAIAWKVIKDCGQGWSHEFTYPMNFQVGASDASGNRIIKPLDACTGQTFRVAKGPSGTELNFVSNRDQQDLEVHNDLNEGSISAEIYKDGKLLLVKHNISPNQKASFTFQPKIWIGVTSQVNEGNTLNTAIVSISNTEISLLGISSADIVMTGGGVGNDAKAFSFSLNNIDLL